MCIESLLRSDRRYQTERGSVSGISNEPNWSNLLYVALGPPFILSRGYPQVAGSGTSEEGDSTVNSQVLQVDCLPFWDP